MRYSLAGRTPQIHAGAYVAPGADVIGDVVLDEDSSVWFGAVLRGDIERIRVGRGSNIQDGTIMHTDATNPCTVDEFVTVGHRATLHGCHIGSGSLIGIGAVLLNGARIGQRCIVGANALVTEGKQFPDGVLLMGTPAKIARDLRPGEIEAIQANSNRYIARARLYREQLQALDQP